MPRWGIGHRYDEEKLFFHPASPAMQPGHPVTAHSGTTRGAFLCRAKHPATHRANDVYLPSQLPIIVSEEIQIRPISSTSRDAHVCIICRGYRGSLWLQHGDDAHDYSMLLFRSSSIRGEPLTIC